jgi:hypothetical protein
MAYTTINKFTDHFNTLTYAGTGSTGTKTGVGFQPDLTWIKARNNTTWHYLYDAVRTAGIEKEIHSNSDAAEGASDGAAYGYLSAFTSDGFSLYNGTSASQALNESGKNYVAWNWKANGQGSSNTDGSINTTYTSVNTTAGFSISTYTGTGSNATVGHGLGSVPKMIIVKRTNATDVWRVYHSSIGATKHLVLNTTAVEATGSNVWNDTAPTSSVFSISTDSAVNASGATYVAYCFAEKTGYSKFDSFTGNGNDNGPFIYTGFKPAFLLLKETTAGTNDSWFILDNKRNTYNPESKNLRPNNSDAEADSAWMKIDFLSNGFKLRDDDASINESGKNYIYMAFAAEPLVANVGASIPATAQ